MAISTRVLDELNLQIKHELESYYIYLSMSAWLHGQSLDGMANWMRIQAHEEMEHAMRLFSHIIDRGEKVKLLDLKQLKTEWNSPLEIFKDAYEHEKFISGRMNTIMKVVKEENDYTSEPLLSWFIGEQIEEEANASKIVDQLKMIGEEGKGRGLFLIDKELGARPWPGVSPLNPSALLASD
ncbi:MAG: ferritin [Caldisericia bacterium]|nr:ferritin [Caldisericia bacterium]